MVHLARAAAVGSDAEVNEFPHRLAQVRRRLWHREPDLIRPRKSHRLHRQPSTRLNAIAHTHGLAFQPKPRNPLIASHNTLNALRGVR